MGMFSLHIFYGDGVIIAYCIFCLRGTSTISSCCPDFLLWLGNLLLFLGEEKVNPTIEDLAKEDLEKKIAKVNPTFFGNIQYMICYTANGPKLCFYAFDGSLDTSKQPDHFIPLMPVMNMTWCQGRFNILHMVINITCILLSIKDSIPAAVYPLAKRIHLGDSKITFSVKGVEKRLLATKLPCNHGV